jgi:hypothetical protein
MMGQRLWVTLCTRDLFSLQVWVGPVVGAEAQAVTSVHMSGSLILGNLEAAWEAAWRLWFGATELHLPQCLDAHAWAGALRKLSPQCAPISLSLMTSQGAYFTLSPVPGTTTALPAVYALHMFVLLLSVPARAQCRPSTGCPPPASLVIVVLCCSLGQLTHSHTHTLTRMDTQLFTQTRLNIHSHTLCLTRVLTHQWNSQSHTHGYHNSPKHIHTNTHSHVAHSLLWALAHVTTDPSSPGLAVCK